jgi:hypothetical protein
LGFLSRKRKISGIVGRVEQNGDFFVIKIESKMIPVIRDGISVSNNQECPYFVVKMESKIATIGRMQIFRSSNQYIPIFVDVHAFNF